jgi:hypothetical protein
LRGLLPVIRGALVTNGGINRASFTMGSPKTLRVGLTGSGQLNTQRSGAAQVGKWYWGNLTPSTR